jgi:hypothetical protein
MEQTGMVQFLEFIMIIFGIIHFALTFFYGAAIIK